VYVCACISIFIGMFTCICASVCVCVFVCVCSLSLSLSHTHTQGFLAAELEQTTCPICYELMVAPVHTPTLLFPCGHTFCVQCLNSHMTKNGRRTCPFCRNSIESQAPNVLMQQLIDGYIQKKENKMGLGATKGTSKAGNSARLKEVEEDTSIAGPLGWDVEEDSGDVVEYRRQWRMVSMRWKIYENEEKDYRIDVAALASKFVIHRYTHTHTHTHTQGDVHIYFT